MKGDQVPHEVRDAATVQAQLGRQVRGLWRVAERCTGGFPQAIATVPLIEDRSPFPTLYWLTCPHLVRAVGVAESAGAVSAWARRLAEEPDLAARQRSADADYRSARCREGAGSDPCGDVGIAGQRDPLATKCIHAHVAAYLGGIDDPAGEVFLAGVARECGEATCARLHELGGC